MKMIVIGAATVCAALTMSCSDSIGTITPVIESSTTATGVASLRDSLIQKPGDVEDSSFDVLKVSSPHKQSSSALISSTMMSSSSQNSSSTGVVSSNAFVSSSLIHISSVSESSADVVLSSVGSSSSMGQSSLTISSSSMGQSSLTISSSSLGQSSLTISSSSLAQSSLVLSSSSILSSSEIVSSSSVTPIVLLINEFDYDAYKDSEIDQQTTLSTATSPEIYYQYWASMGRTGDKVNLRKDAKDSVAYLKMATPDLTGMTRIVIKCKRTATTTNEWFLALRYKDNGLDYWTPSAEFGSKVTPDTTGVEVEVSMTATEFGLLNFDAVNKLNLIGRADNSTVSIQMNTMSADNR